VARAAAASAIPLISAVGHETDTTLIDYVSDRRAPTPTAAAEMAVPVRLDLLAHIDGQGARLTGALARGMARRGERLRDLARALPRPDTLLAGPRQRLDHAGERLPLALRGGLQHRRARLGESAAPLRPQMLRLRLRGLSERLAREAERLAPALTRHVAGGREGFGRLEGRLSPVPVLRETRRRRDALDTLAHRLHGVGQAALRERRERLAAVERLLQSLNYQETLKRGYAVVRGDDAVVTTRAAAEQARGLEIEFADGRLRIGATQRKAQNRSDGPDQGSLF
ncbi:MAG: exodeoxyribonuclease VII large subunit, partial [Tropicimonas sp.]|uniref:exodeoxyribonuclease VII large subunit n=1 Tax=Tropicimonas sp. TaxID=2067044 RepID=UPI003A8C600B